MNKHRRFNIIISNRELVQHMTEAFLRGDIAAVQECLSEDIIWYFPGRSIVAGVFRGKEAVLKHLSEPRRLGARLELTPRAFFGDEQYGVVLYELNTTRNGKTLTETRVMLCTIDNDKVVEIRIFTGDQYALDEFWS
jgi:ketosteroid isomerase-like protein